MKSSISLFTAWYCTSMVTERMGPYAVDSIRFLKLFFSNKFCHEKMTQNCEQGITLKCCRRVNSELVIGFLGQFYPWLCNSRFCCMPFQKYKITVHKCFSLLKTV